MACAGGLCNSLGGPPYFADGSYILYFNSTGNNLNPPVDASSADIYYFTTLGGVITGHSSFDTTTHFIHVDPTVGSTTATTTTIGAHLYVNENDYVSGTYLSMSFTNQTVSLLGGSALDAFNSSFQSALSITIPLVSGENTVSTTTTFTSAGRTNATYRIVIPDTGFLATLGFGSDSVFSTTTSFFVGYATPLDNAVSQGADSTAQYILTGTTTGATTIVNCGAILTGGLVPCLVSLVVPSPQVISDDFTRLRNGFLSAWPLGYVTRFVSIFTASTSAPIPVLSAVIPAGIVGSGSRITLDLNHSLDYILNRVPSSISTTTQTFYEVTSYYWNILVYLGLAFYILRRVLGFHIIPTINKEGGVGDKPYGPQRP